MTMTPTPPPTAQARPAANLTPIADAILALHTPDDTGMCTQCRFEGRLIPHPCTHHRWADAVDRSTPTHDTLLVLGLLHHLDQPPQ
ncbi:hypothetical protein EDC02_5054 [Micromonospora sp. Llam0]|uniref:hypothetical protein n=1 Tax=Micromonospora sp. Llam0 TaxID=2485143 RepID=UPI000F4A3F4A|nr:hypothetical protein [Micromonospora sp. Llam0]ROO63043.1 hypothetical protein EDC02_5054 [Micromonospora sp. Llam0]